MASKSDDVDSSKLPSIKRLAPVLAVESLEDCLPFWTERLGFAVTMSVPAPDGALAFAILQCGDIEIMYQSHESVMADGNMTAADVAGHSVALFLEVESIDAVEKALLGAPVVKARHQTFYGSTEIYVKEPGGNIVGFSQMG